MTLETSVDFGQKFFPKNIEPTAEQLRIQTSSAKTLIVEANAGAAKTTTLALRMAEAWTRGVRPEAILALTYTETACAALLSALRKIGVPERVASAFRVQTFEAFSAGVLHDLFGQVPSIHEAEALAHHVWDAVLQVEKRESVRWRDDLIFPNLGDAAFLEEFLRVNAVLKGTMRDVLEREDSAIDPEYAASIRVDFTQLKVYLAFERIRTQQFALTPMFRGFGDATYDLAKALHEGEDVRHARSWPRSAKVLLVDEMHDLNRAMFSVLVELLHTTPAFFCGVGDADQVIHETAGADVQFMREAVQISTGREISRLPLTQTFRFSRTLASLAGHIANKPYSSLATHKSTVRWEQYSEAEDCADLTVGAINAARRSGAKASDVAVLLRHSYQTVDIENALLRSSIPYQMRGFQSYLHRPEVLFVRGLLAIATGRLETVSSAETREQIMRALLLFARTRIQVEGREGESQYELLREAISLVNGNPHLLQTLFFENQVLRNTDDGTRKKLQKAVKVAQQESGPHVLTAVLEALDIGSMVRESFATQQRREEALGNIRSLERVALRTAGVGAFFEDLNRREQKQSEMRDSASIVLGSVVQVKGLEFDHVVLPFLEAGEFPASSCSERDEKNKFYVGATRARHSLTLLVSARAPSSFTGYESRHRLPEEIGRPV